MKKNAVPAEAVNMQQSIVPPSPLGHPEWDVYVNGRYEGSDPNPRVRASIRKEVTHYNH